MALRGGRLIRTEYYKVFKGNMDLFLKRRYYICSNDGQIRTDFITAETYYRNLEEGKSNASFYELRFEDLKLPVQDFIKEHENEEIYSWWKRRKKR